MDPGQRRLGRFFDLVPRGLQGLDGEPERVGRRLDVHHETAGAHLHDLVDEYRFVARDVFDVAVVLNSGRQDGQVEVIQSVEKVGLDDDGHCPREHMVEPLGVEGSCEDPENVLHLLRVVPQLLVAEQQREPVAFVDDCNDGVFGFREGQFLELAEPHRMPICLERQLGVNYKRTHRRVFFLQYPKSLVEGK